MNKDVIKYIAMFTMLLNHIATIFLEEGTLICEILTAIGYFTAITMIYFLVEGYRYTRSKRKYFLRLLIFALVSEAPYCLAFTKGAVIEFYAFNMFFTLCICFGMIWAADHFKNKFLKAVLWFLGILFSVRCSWGILAPVFTILFWWTRDSVKGKRISFALSTLIFGAFCLLNGSAAYSPMKNVSFALLDMAGMAAAGISILFFYNGKRAARGRNFSKWFFYIFYPGHLLILGLIRIFTRG